MRNPFRKKIKPRGQTKRPGPTLFFTGFMMSFFIFTILRVASMKLPINFFVPVMVCFSLAGSAFGAFFSHSFNAKSARAFHVLVMSAILIFLGAVFFNMKVPTVYMLFKAELPIELPPNAGFHSCAEIIALIFNGFVFCLLGYHFSRAFNQAQNAARSYALHLAGFFLGGLAAYIFIPVLGLYTCLMAAVLAIAFRYSGSRAMAGMAFLFSIVLVVFARHTTESFFIWQLPEYKKISTIWSPYSKIDFITYPDGEYTCMASLYNNFLMNGVCPDPMKDHYQRRKVFEIVSPGRDDALIIGAGTGMSMLSLYNANPHMKHAVGVEIDPVVARETTGRLSKFNKGIYSRPGMEIAVADARRFMDSDTRQYDLIFIDGIDNYLNLYLGSVIAAENYMYTEEGYSRIFNDRLKKDGVLIMNHGGTIAPAAFPFLLGLPKDVYYRLYWYVIVDPPFHGAPLFFMIASKDKNVLENYALQLNEDSGMIPVRKPESMPNISYTDNHPVLYLIYIYLLVPLSGLLLAGAAALVWRTHRSAVRRGGPETAMPFLYFILLGAAYAMVETLIIIKLARFFDSPAKGAIVVLTLFIAGTAAANLLFGMRPPDRVSPKRLRVRVWIQTVFLSILCVTATTINSPDPVPILSFLVGFLAGAFWPAGLMHVAPSARHYAYAMDGLGAILGTLTFQVVFLLLGLSQAAIVIFVIVAAIAIIHTKITKRMSSPADAPETSSPAPGA